MPRRSRDPLFVQRQVVAGLEQQFNDTTLDEADRGYAALEIACSFITGYGHADKDFGAALTWIQSSRVWSDSWAVGLRLQYALGKEAP